MPVVKVSEATGLVLDWLVAKADGIAVRELLAQKWSQSLYRNLLDEDGELNGRYMTGPDLLFSRKWEAGGPIIERELNNLFKHNQIDKGAPPVWCAVINVPGEHGTELLQADGPTPLIAAMRCYVVSKLGGEVEVPEEIC